MKVLLFGIFSNPSVATIKQNGTGDAAELLARLGSSGELSGIQQDLSNIARDLIELLELQYSYPVLIYFRFRKTYYTLPRVILLAIDTATLIKSALNADKYRSLLHFTAVAELWSGSTHIPGLSESILPKHQIKCDRQAELAWRQRYYHAVERLSAEGIEMAAVRSGCRFLSCFAAQMATSFNCSRQLCSSRLMMQCLKYFERLLGGQCPPYALSKIFRLRWEW